MEPEVVANPEIVWRSDEILKGWEGCLSIPGIRGHVPGIGASAPVTGPSTATRSSASSKGFVARVFQHEDDHLRGVVFLDRLESNRDIVCEKEFRNLDAK